MKIKELQDRLSACGAENPKAEAQIIIEQLFNVSYATQLADPKREYPNNELEKVIEKRIGGGSLGFGANVKSPGSIDAQAVAEHATHQDLVKFGLIPELVGRLPVITGLKGMDKQTLIRIMTEPKNSIIKQYQALFSLDGIELRFENDALERIAELTIQRKTGARGLRSIIEATLQPLMYNTPSDTNIKTVTVTAETVDGKEAVIENK